MRWPWSKRKQEPKVPKYNPILKVIKIHSDDILKFAELVDKATNDNNRVNNYHLSSLVYKIIEAAEPNPEWDWCQKFWSNNVQPCIVLLSEQVDLRDLERYVDQWRTENSFNSPKSTIQTNMESQVG